MNIALQDEKVITVPSTGSVFEELQVSLCVDQWTPGLQKRTAITWKENMELFMSLMKES